MKDVTPAERLTVWLNSIPPGQKGKALEMVETFAALNWRARRRWLEDWEWLRAWRVGRKAE